MYRLLLLLVAMVLAQPVFAADWARVVALESGRIVKVESRGKVKTAGVLRGVTADSIRVETRSGEKTIPMAEVTKVRVRSGQARARNGAISGAIAGGITAGGLTAIVVAMESSVDGEDAALIAGFSLLMAGAAAGVTALFPGYSTVYHVK